MFPARLELPILLSSSRTVAMLLPPSDCPTQPYAYALPAHRSPPFLQLLSLPRRPSLDTATVGLASAASAIPAAAAIAAPTLRGCDICFEAPQELQLLPCPHRMCASCARRVVQMHTAKQAPPRCPFCQANIKGLAPVPLAPGLEGQQQQQQPALVLPTRRSFHGSRSHAL